MLFNSFEFIFIFLPITITLYCLIFFLFKKNLSSIIIFVLALMSMIFYGYWDVKYIFLILFSIIFNFFISKYITKDTKKGFYLFFGIFINLLLLSYFKYFNFIIFNIENLISYNFSFNEVVLPLAISFFTFLKCSILFLMP